MSKGYAVSERRVLMTLDYPPSARRASQPSTRDHVYTTLLGVLAFLMVIVVATGSQIATRPSTSPERASHLWVGIYLNGAVLIAIIPVLFIRLLSPAKRRWPTVWLNVVLLILFPLGTALGLYGLLFVDRSGRQERIRGHS